MPFVIFSKLSLGIVIYSNISHGSGHCFVGLFHGHIMKGKSLSLKFYVGSNSETAGYSPPAVFPLGC